MHRQYDDVKPRRLSPQDNQLFGTCAQFPESVRVYGCACAYQVTVSVSVVNPSDRGPEFILSYPWQRVCRLLTRICMIPVVCND